MARCTNCGASLPPKSLNCEFCGTRNDVDLNGVHEYTLSTPESERPCPLCELPMETIDLKINGTFLIERCGKCMSIFFDPNEIETLLEKSVSPVYNVDFKRFAMMDGEHPATTSKIRYYKCPVCSKLMNRVNFGSRSGVVVDRCADHGVWLERGELRRLLEWKKAGGEILDSRRQAERKKEEERGERKRRRKAAGSGANSGFIGTDAGVLLTDGGIAGDVILESIVDFISLIFE